jgi:hypothetical protein
MPWAAQQLTTTAVLIVAWHCRLDEPDDAPLAQGCPFMRAPIADGEILALDIEDTDLASIDLNQQALARRDLIHGRNHMLRHQSNL